MEVETRLPHSVSDLCDTSSSCTQSKQSDFFKKMSPTTKSKASRGCLDPTKIKKKKLGKHDLHHIYPEQRILAVRRVPIGRHREKQASSQMDKQQKGVTCRRRNENECLPMKKEV